MWQYYLFFALTITIPQIIPQMPPIMCVNSEILLVLKNREYISCPRYIIATKIRDRGIFPPLIPEIDERNIIINTIPDAPRSAVPSKNAK